MEIPGYRIQREIGRGGMATVYLAIQESLHRPVVLKILDAMKMDKAEDLVDRFLAEGRILATLNHPNIITIYDIGIANSTLYISMEYVQGGDLKQRLELSTSPQEALDYMVQIANALGEAHKHGIVHRDVKPANILFKGNTPVLTDFGIAKHVDTDNDLTSTGIFLGSPNYVSPEQAEGSKLDGRADIYSLGCIFYEMLTGSKPYISDSIIDIVIQHKTAPIPTLPREYRHYQPLLNRMLAKKRSDRFPDAEALVKEINKFREQPLSITGEYSITGEHTAPNFEVRQKRKQRILVGLILIALVVFSTLKYVEIRIKDTDVKTDRITTETVLSTDTVQSPAGPLPAASVADLTDAPVADAGKAGAEPVPEPVNEEILTALTFLGRQSLETYKLTYPPNDNAYYYFTRLLELQPGNETAFNGILEIAERYSYLAEQALLKNEEKKAAAYVDIGLRINPDNKSLNSIRSFMVSQDKSLLDKIKDLF